MYRTILTASFVALLAAALSCVALVLFGVSVARQAIERSAAAHTVLESHLEIEVAVFQLFKQLTDEVLTDDGFVDPDIADAQARLSDRISTTRHLIAREVAMDGSTSAEAEELDRLGQIEVIVAEVAVALRAIDAADGGADERIVASVLEQLIDSDLRAIIDAATAEEQREVAEVEAAAAAQLDRVARLSWAAAGLAVLVCLVGGSTLRRKLSRPLTIFDEAARAVAAGDFDRRIPDLGGNEFGLVARSLNRMLDELDLRRATVEQAREELEATVQQRTGALAAANQALTRADETRRRFLADVSHELRTPLTIIRGEAEVTLRARAAGIEDLRLALTRIAEQAGLTARLVDDLLFALRVEAGDPHLERARTPLAAIARRAAEDAAALAEARGITVTVLAATDPVVLGDAGRLRQLAMILLANAVRYSHPGGRVEVRVTEAADTATLAVRDEGIGIAPEELPRIFERFHRGANAVAQSAEGTGLGLSIARAIAEAHGGTIRVDSVLGAGSTFAATFPVTGRMRAVA